MNGAVAVAKSSTPVEQSGISYQYQEGVVGRAVALNGNYGLKLMDNANALGESYTISFWMNAKMSVLVLIRQSPQGYSPQNTG